MAFGTLGSTLNDELNRLANGGTYRDADDMVDEALAAKQWANRENIVPYSTDTVGILNEIAALGPNRQNWFDFNGVCNYLAGTTGLPAAAALRQITTTGDILTSLAAFYTDAATPRYNYPGYIRLDGAFTQSISTPDATALDITGDIDLRAYVAADDWTPSARNILISKATGTQNSYEFNIETDGTLRFYWSADGTTLIVKPSTAAVPFANGAAGWVRVTLDVNNGASGNDVKFFTSTDGTTWTQLGSTVTTAGVTSIFNSTSNVFLGTASNGASNPLTGNLYRAQIFASIDGTDKRLDVDLTTNVTSATYDQFTATTGQLCTINGQNTLTNGGSAGSLLPVTVGSSLAADSNDAKFLAHDGTNYVYLPGTGANILIVPDSAALRVTGDIDIRGYIALDNYANGTNQVILSKWASVTTKSYGLYVGPSGNLGFYYSGDGTTTLNNLSSVPLSVVGGTPTWVRVTFASATGTIYYYTSTNGTSWTQLGSVQTGTATTLNANASQVEIGSIYAGSVLAGKIYRAQIFNGIDGTKVLDVDTSVITSGADTYVVPTTYTGQAGGYFTGSGLSLNGVSGNYVSTPNATPLQITGDIDLQVKVALADWTPGTETSFIGRWSASYSYYLSVNSSGNLRLQWLNSSSVGQSKTSTVATGITDGTTKWVRATLDVDNGASGHDVKFFLSDDGVTWTQLGATVTTAGTTNILAGSGLLGIGAAETGTVNLANGTFYRAIVKSGIDGYPVFDADFTQVPANALRMTESSINKAVVTLNTTRYATINRSTSGRKTVAVTQPTWLFGTDDYMEVNNRYMAHSTSDENYVYLSGNTGNYMSVADNPPLDITSDLDIQVKVALDDWTPSTANSLVAKFVGTGNQRSYQLRVNTTGTLFLGWSTTGADNPNQSSTVATGLTDGAVKWVRATLDVDNGAGGYDVKFFLSDNGTTWTQLGSTITGAGTTSVYSGTAPVEIGSRVSGTDNLAKGAFYRAIIKNGIDGTTVLDANAAVITLPSQTTFTDSSSNAYTVTINKSGVGTFVSTGNYMYLPGVDSNNASTPDAAALDITGDIDLRFKVAMDDWTPSVSPYFISKSSSGAGNYSYWMALNTNGTLVLGWSNNGTAIISRNSTVAPTVADGATLWIRAVLDVDNGAAGHDVIFYTSTDGLTWTQLGATVTTAGTTSIYSGTSQLQVGTFSSAGAARGKFFRAQVLNGIGGTLAFDANFESSITSLTQTTFTESSSNAATVTINRSGSAYRSAGVIAAGYLYPGATNTFANSTIDYLNFGATQSFTALVAIRQWATPGAYRRYIAKQISGMNNAWGLMPDNVSFRVWSAIRDSGTEVNGGVVAFTQGDLSTLSMVTNRTTETLTSYSGATAGTPTSTVGKGSLALPGSMFIGTTPAGSPQDFEFVAAAVFRQALTATQIRQITNYFANREVYL